MWTAAARIHPVWVGAVAYQADLRPPLSCSLRESGGVSVRERGKTFKYMTDCGVQPVLIRVDNAKALTVGSELGVSTFQGFLIDDSIRKRAA